MEAAASITIVRQSGVVPYRDVEGSVHVLLITNTAGDRWLVPKGKVEPAMSAQQSAAKEALEEAGVQGVLDPVPLGTIEYDRLGERRIIDVYPLHVRVQHERWPEMERRQRRWLPIDSAAAEVNDPGLVECLAALVKRLRTCAA